jgi:hypothetical protein
MSHVIKKSRNKGHESKTGDFWKVEGEGIRGDMGGG